MTLDPRVRREIEARFDENETVFLSRQLEYIRAQTADRLYAPKKSRMFIPEKTPRAPVGANSITFRSYDKVGKAALIANYARDFPRIDVFGTEYTRTVKGVGASYGWSIQELRSAAFSGVPLDPMKARAAREAIELELDEILAVGVSGLSNFEGFLNHPTVPIVPEPNGDWPNADPLEIIEDITALVQSVVTISSEVHKPDTLLLDTASYSICSQTPVSATNPDKTILRWILDNNPYIKNIDQWGRLDLADDAGTGPRIMAYVRDPMFVYYEMPLDFEQSVPQQVAMDFVTFCHSRVGGTVIPYPLSLAYMDNIGEP